MSIFNCCKKLLFVLAFLVCFDGFGDTRLSRSKTPQELNQELKNISKSGIFNEIVATRRGDSISIGLEAGFRVNDIIISASTRTITSQLDQSVALFDEQVQSFQM